MNYLSHLFLSGPEIEVSVGNFIGDGVKGAITEEWSPEVQVGLHLHRFIDSYADGHPINMTLKAMMYPHFSKYAGVVLDMVHDHFLALRWERYSEEPLEHFIDDRFERFEEYVDIFPAKSLRLFRAMKQGDWMLNYRSLDGMDRAFKGISRRARFESGMENGAAVLKAEYEALEKGFHAFYPDIIEAAEEERLRLHDLMTTR